MTARPWIAHEARLGRVGRVRHATCSFRAFMRSRAQFLALFLAAGCGGTTASTSSEADGGTLGPDSGTDAASSGDAGGGDAAPTDGGANSALTDGGAGYDAGVCTDCVPAAVEWGYNGGLTIYVDVSSLTTCHTYKHERQSSGRLDAGALPSCADEIGACGAPAIAVGDVERALAHPDVVRALASPTTPIYGQDNRATDGAVLRVTVTAGTPKSIDVGSDCPSPPVGTCAPVPAGVRALTNLLTDLDKQELAKPACAAFH